MKLATEEDVDAIGVSSLATDHLIVPKLIEALRDSGLGHVGVVVGGIVPDDERPTLLQAGVSAIFGPGASRNEIVEQVATIAARRGPATPTFGSARHEQGSRSTAVAWVRSGLRPMASGVRRQIGDDPGRESLGIEIKPLYTPRDWNGSAYESDLGFPGHIRSRAACTRRCTAAAPGRSAN